MPVSPRLHSASPAATRSLGVALGEALRPGDFVALGGPLGAGKTALARGVAEGAGVDPADVSSPTYSIVQSYPGRALRLHHADLYRLRGEDDLYATGYHELLEQPGAAVLVEWFDQVPGAVPEDALLVRLAPAGEAERELELEATGPGARALLERWLSRLGGSGAAGG